MWNVSVKFIIKQNVKFQVLDQDILSDLRRSCRISWGGYEDCSTEAVSGVEGRTGFNL